MAPVFYDSSADDTPVHEDDLLAPVHYDDEAAPADEPSVVGVDDLDADFDNDGDGGFSDQSQVVRVWLDGHRINRIRLSPNWARRLGPRRTLGQAFSEALFLANNQPTAQADVPDPESFDATLLDREPTFGTVEVVMSFLGELSDRETAAMQQLADRPVVESRSAGVTVALNELGQVTGVTFDDAWLARAQPGEICERVDKTADAAQQKYAAQGGDAGLAEIEQTRVWLMSVMKRMMSTKENTGV